MTIWWNSGTPVTYEEDGEKRSFFVAVNMLRQKLPRAKPIGAFFGRPRRPAGRLVVFVIGESSSVRYNISCLEAGAFTMAWRDHITVDRPSVTGRRASKAPASWWPCARQSRCRTGNGRDSQKLSIADGGRRPRRDGLCRRTGTRTHGALGCMMLKFKVDENLPTEAAELLARAGHDAVTVHDQRMVGQPDTNVASIC